MLELSEKTTTLLFESAPSLLERTTTIPASGLLYPNEEYPTLDLELLAPRPCDEMSALNQRQRRSEETSIHNQLRRPLDETYIHNLNQTRPHVNGISGPPANLTQGRSTPLATKLMRDPFTAKRRNPLAINLSPTKPLVTKRRPLLGVKRLHLFVGRQLTKNPLARRKFKKRRLGQSPSAGLPSQYPQRRKGSLNPFRRHTTKVPGTSQPGEAPKAKTARRRKLPRLMLKGRRSKRESKEDDRHRKMARKAARARKQRRARKKILGMPVPSLKPRPKTKETTPVGKALTEPAPKVVVRQLTSSPVFRTPAQEPEVAERLTVDNLFKIKPDTDRLPKDRETQPQIRDPLPRERLPEETQRGERLPRERVRPEQQETISQQLLQQQAAEDCLPRSRDEPRDDDHQRGTRIPRQRQQWDSSREHQRRQRKQQSQPPERQRSVPSPVEQPQRQWLLKTQEKEPPQPQRRSPSREIILQPRSRVVAPQSRRPLRLQYPQERKPQSAYPSNPAVPQQSDKPLLQSNEKIRSSPQQRDRLPRQRQSDDTARRSGSPVGRGEATSRSPDRRREREDEEKIEGKLGAKMGQRWGRGTKEGAAREVVGGMQGIRGRRGME